MTASEFAFLAVGLVLGIATGAAIVDAARSRPSNSREVRVTVAPGSVPKRRSATLAEDAFAGAYQQPARGGPGDRSDVVADLASQARPGTPVLSGASDPFVPTDRGSAVVGIPIHRESDPALASLRAAAAQTAEQAMSDQRMTIEAILERAQATRSAARAQSAAESSAAIPLGSASTAVAEADGSAQVPQMTASADAAATGTTVEDGCAEVRRVADERCTIATRSREQATAAEDALRTAQHEYDDHHTAAEKAALDADPRQMRTAKEEAQSAFRDARAAATSREAVEAAARDWLTGINRINHDAREAGNRLQRERAAANALVTQIERLTVEADAARISAESAEAACLAAREAVADCQEAAAAPRRQTFIPTPAALGFAADGMASEETGAEAAFSLNGDGEPAILRLVRGDHDAMTAVVGAVAGDDQAQRQRWQAMLGRFVEAIIARAIEESALTFPVEHGFWGAFTLAQNRDIVSALSSLGYRYDGLGGWADDHLPGQRDLSLAVGYAGLDPMRVRHWPTENETAELLREVSVAADEYLSGAAGGLTLGELVTALGRRADDLTELWNEWGRVRPVLLAD